MLSESPGARKRRDTGCLSRPQEDSALPTPRFLTSGSQSCAGASFCGSRACDSVREALVKQHTSAFWIRWRSASFSGRADYRRTDCFVNNPRLPWEEGLPRSPE